MMKTVTVMQKWTQTPFRSVQVNAYSCSMHNMQKATLRKESRSVFRTILHVY